MANVGTIRFYNARIGVSGLGLEIAQLGSGTYDHLGFFGPNGNVSAVQVGSFQDTTQIVDSAGNPLVDHNSAQLPFGGSGYLTNNRQDGPSGVVISGLPLGPFSALLGAVNVFDPGNFAIEPDFLHRNSGTLLIEYKASGVSQVHVFNPKAFAYDATGAITDAPPDIQVFGYEINASGQWYSAGTSGVWQQTTGQSSPIFLANHSNANGWQPENRHYFVLGLSVKPTAVGVLDDWNFAFQLQFA